MDRYQRIDNFVKKMEKQYRPDDKSRQEVDPFIDMLNDPQISDNDFDHLRTLVENTHKRHAEPEENRSISQEGVIEIEEAYDQQMGNVVDITKEVEKVIKDPDTLALLTTKPKGEA